MSATSIIRKALTLISGNPLAQRILERNVQVSQVLMGVGAGSGADISGESAVFRTLRQRYPEPYCVFDVGANKGQFLQVALKGLEGSRFTVHCFEPGHETFRALTATAAGNANVVLNNIGLGNTEGEATLHYDVAGSGIASLTRRRLDHFGVDFSQSETVALTTLDAYCTQHEIPRIDLLKIDIEGHELDALAGAKGLFERKAIGMVTFEFGGCNIDTRSYFQDFWYFFQGVGMRILRITPSGYLHPVAAYNELHEQFRTTNFVAMP